MFTSTSCQIIPFQNKLYYCAVDFPLTSLYLNSLLANLNAREYIRAAPWDDDYNTYPMEERLGGMQLETLRPSRAKIRSNDDQVGGICMVYVHER